MKFLKKLFYFPFFGVLAGFIPLFILWNSNNSQIHTRDMWYSLLLTSGFVLLVSALFFISFKNKVKANLGLTAVFLLFFSYGHLYTLIKENTRLNESLGFIKLLAIYAVLFVVLLVFLIRKKKIKISSSSILLLNGIAILLCLFNVFSIVSYNLRSRTALSEADQNSSTTATLSNGSDQQLADIYYIVLDAYSRQDILLQLMNYDNSAFISSLRERGFYVADCANSNYDGTVSSMASSLNYSYLDEIVEGESELSKTASLIDNRIRADLKEYGYTFVTTRGFSSENDIPNADIYLNYLNNTSEQEKIERNQFTRLYFETTLLRAFIELYDQDPVRYSSIPNWLILADENDGILGYATYWYNQTNYVFDSLTEFPQNEGNYFVYAHINLPHGPYVFDANGNFKYVYNPEDNIPYYTEAVTYANKRTLQLIDSLLANSSTPPIIILQGDHAAHEITTGFDKNKILSAFYLPETIQEDLYETITPVNTFRLILRDYFGQDIGLLPDLVYAKEFNTYEYRPSACEP